MKTVAITVASLILGAPLSAAPPQSSDLEPRIVQQIQAGLQARRQNRLEDEIKAFETVVTLDPDLAEGHMNLGLALRRRGDREQALAALRRAVELKPQLTAAQAILGFEALKSGRVRKALRHLETAYHAAPSDANVNLWLGRTYFELGRFAEASFRLESARQSEAEDPEVLYYLTQAYAEAAQETRDLLAAAAPESAQFHHAEGRRAAAAGLYAQAIEQYEAALEAESSLAEVQADLGALHAELNNPQAAEQALRAAIDLRPEHAETHFRCAEAVLRQGRLKEALSFFDRALDLDPSLIAQSFELSNGLAQQGEFDGATAVLSTLEERDIDIQTRTLVHHRLADLYSDQGDRKQAAHHRKAFSRLTKEIERVRKLAAKASRSSQAK